MLHVVIPVIVVATGAAAYFKARPLRREMTVHQKRVYQGALAGLKDPKSLRELAEAFRAEGFKAEASLLEKRAALRELPKEIRDERRRIFRKAMGSKDPDKVLVLALAFDEEGCTGAAECLRKYANGLREANDAANQS